MKARWTTWALALVLTAGLAMAGENQGGGGPRGGGPRGGGPGGMMMMGGGMMGLFGMDEEESLPEGLRARATEIRRQMRDIEEKVAATDAVKGARDAVYAALRNYTKAVQANAGANKAFEEIQRLMLKQAAERGERRQGGQRNRQGGQFQQMQQLMTAARELQTQLKADALAQAYDKAEVAWKVYREALTDACAENAAWKALDSEAGELRDWMVLVTLQSMGDMPAGGPPGGGPGGPGGMGGPPGGGQNQNAAPPPAPAEEEF